MAARLDHGAVPFAQTRDTDGTAEDTARERAIYQALKALDEVAAALQTHLIEEHGADPERAAARSPSTNSLKLLRQARERLGQGLRAIGRMRRRPGSLTEQTGIVNACARGAAQPAELADNRARRASPSV